MVYHIRIHNDNYSSTLAAIRLLILSCLFRGPEYQAEVALLSRNILLQGSKKSESYKKGPGMRIMGQGRLSGVAAYRMGQKNVVGAYPIHFHHLGYAPHSYVTDSTVYKSYFRGK